MTGATGDARLRLATVNGASGRDTPGGGYAADRLAEAVADLAADVVALQEVDHLLPRSGAVDQTALVAAACARRTPGEDWWHRFTATVHGTPGHPEDLRPATATDPAEPSYGTALLTRLPVERVDELRLGAGRARLPLLLPSPARGPRLVWIPDEPRVAVAAVLTGPAGPFTVVGTHLSFSPPSSVRQLLAVRRWLAPFPRPLFLLGDLNLPPAAVQPLSGMAPLVTAPTFPAPAPRVQLDHVLADGLTWPVRAAGAHRVGGSDHLGLVVELETPSP
ncbi:endonuclease/exonuclease/phosphatase family protein [Kineococcus sp. SYSU DK004]|uniref:endonuclease/exonuclease/phosphatase family protein n=1 Tax=Kineococcus sp. SYSU DK004 TaxID=3383125 RepID=UPI003D7CD93B